MHDIKRRLELTFFGPMRDPALRDAFRASLRGGLLLYGPPGCGKTFVARAIAGEIGARFVAVGLHDVLDMWMGNSEKRLHEIFEHARRFSPSVLFFDEVDALGLKRSTAAQTAGRGVIAQLLDELDGATADNSGVFVLGATNAPWDVDSALRRPGRFDRTMFVPPPDREARQAILTFHLKGRPHAIRDLSEIANQTDGFSGADLRLVCETAAELALEASMANGAVTPIAIDHLKKATRSIRPSIGAWLEAARNVVAFSNQSGDYDELANYFRSRR
jgi:SpoVK/Ycf46/Vps4 family AAA+-type ATPase